MERLKKCKQVNCDVSKDGKCLEGLETADCPHFYWDEDTQDGEISFDGPQDNTIDKQPVLQLFPGTELAPEQMTIITNKYRCSLVVILGEFDCGKTTLLSAFFDLFQIGFFKKYLFAGSLTQIGFEERSHLSRTISGADKPDTERTKSLEFRLLHLALKKTKSVEVKNLILSDISGETIRQARNSGIVMQARLSLVKQADFIIYMFDGEKLQEGQRHTAMFHANLFIENAIQNGIIGKGIVLNILISKWDILYNDSTFDIDRQLIQPLNSRFSERLAGINYFKIAARPEECTDEIEMGHGLEDILDKITSDDIDKQPIHSLNCSSGIRNFEKFKIERDDK